MITTNGSLFSTFYVTKIKKSAAKVVPKKKKVNKEGIRKNFITYKFKGLLKQLKYTSKAEELVEEFFLLFVFFLFARSYFTIFFISFDIVF